MQPWECDFKSVATIPSTTIVRAPTQLIEVTTGVLPHLVSIRDNVTETVLVPPLRSDSMTAVPDVIIASYATTTSIASGALVAVATVTVDLHQDPTLETIAKMDRQLSSVSRVVLQVTSPTLAQEADPAPVA